jgi:hypothetical protein
VGLITERLLARDPLRAMVLCVTPRYLLVLSALACALHACKKEEQAFLPVPALCEQRGEAICSALTYFCDSEEDDSSCQRRQRAFCIEESEPYEDEPSLSYDTVALSKVRSEEQAALDEGNAPFSLARFFVGGLPVDTQCERDSQCETGLCDGDSSLCSEPPEAQLCDFL